MADDKVELLKQMLLSAWQAPQNALGAGAALYKTGHLPHPRMDEKGLTYVSDVPEGESPQRMGQVSFEPPNESPVSVAHENVHGEQSEKMGPAYLPMDLLAALISKFQSRSGDTDLFNPLEDEAYLRTEPSEGLYNRLQFKKADRR